MRANGRASGNRRFCSGYAVSAVNKVMFPLAGDVFTIFVARVVDRGGKRMRDAFLTDVTPTLGVLDCRQPLPLLKKRLAEAHSDVEGEVSKLFSEENAKETPLKPR